MKVLLDSNVWLAVLGRRAFSRRVWCRLKNEFEAYSGDWIVAEVREKLEVRFGATARTAERYARYVRNSTRRVVLSAAPPRICRDPDDDEVLALAVEAACDFIITNDKDLLVLDGHKGMRILTIHKFVELQGWEFD